MLKAWELLEELMGTLQNGPDCNIYQQQEPDLASKSRHNGAHISLPCLHCMQFLIFRKVIMRCPTFKLT
jgi:hypothetical protein